MTGLFGKRKNTPASKASSRTGEATKSVSFVRRNPGSSVGGPIGSLPPKPPPPPPTSAPTVGGVRPRAYVGGSHSSAGSLSTTDRSIGSISTASTTTRTKTNANRKKNRKRTNDNRAPRKTVSFQEDESGCAHASSSTFSTLPVDEIDEVDHLRSQLERERRRYRQEVNNIRRKKDRVEAELVEVVQELQRREAEESSSLQERRCATCSAALGADEGAQAAAAAGGTTSASSDAAAAATIDELRSQLETLQEERDKSELELKNQLATATHDLRTALADLSEAKQRNEEITKEGEEIFEEQEVDHKKQLEDQRHDYEERLEEQRREYEKRIEEIEARHREALSDAESEAFASAASSASAAALHAHLSRSGSGAPSEDGNPASDDALSSSSHDDQRKSGMLSSPQSSSRDLGKDKEEPASPASTKTTMTMTSRDEDDGDDALQDSLSIKSFTRWAADAVEAPPPDEEGRSSVEDTPVRTNAKVFADEELGQERESSDAPVDLIKDLEAARRDCDAARSENSDLVSKNRQLTETNEALCRDNASLRERVEVHTAEKTEEESNAKALVEGSTTKHKEYESTIAALQEELETSKQEFDELLQERKEDNAALKKSMDGMCQKLTECEIKHEERVESMTAEMARTESRCKEQIDSLKEDLKATQYERDLALLQHDKAADAYEALLLSKQYANRRIVNLTNQLAAVEKSSYSCPQSLSKDEDQVETLTPEMAAKTMRYKKQINTLTKGLKEAQQERDSLLSRSREMAEAYEAILQADKRTHQSLSKDEDEVESLTSEMTAKTMRYKKKIASLTEDLKAAQKERDALSFRCKEMVEAYEALLYEDKTNDARSACTKTTRGSIFSA